MSEAWQVAQINVGRLLASKRDSGVQPVLDALYRINGLADASSDVQPDPWCVGRA